MRVLVLHSELGVLQGGGENFTRNLFAAFTARGHQVAAAFVANRRGTYAFSVPKCLEPIPLRGWWSRKPGQSTLSAIGGWLPSESPVKATWDFAQEAICWRAIRRHNQRFQQRVERVFVGRWSDFDAVYVHGDAMLAGSVARHRPTVVRLPGPVGDDLAPVLRGVHAVCANGDALERLRTHLGDHAQELPIGIDDQVFRPGPTSVRGRLGWPAGHRVIGYVGRLTQTKGVDLLAAAFRETAKATPDVRLVIVGDGEEERNIRSMLAKECARGMVHIQPAVQQEDLGDWYRAMDLFVMPSRYENFSNAVLEAMACGTPVLASDVGGNRLMLGTGVGWLFAPASTASLTSALAGVIADPARMKAGAARAAETVRGRYSWTASARRLEEIIRSVREPKDDCAHSAVRQN